MPSHVHSVRTYQRAAAFSTALLAAATAVSLIFAQPARASATIGDSLLGTPDNQCPLSPCTALLDKIANLAVKVPSNGVATKWRVKSLSSYSGMQLNILRANGPGDPITAGPYAGLPTAKFQSVANVSRTLSGSGIDTFDIRIAVQANDRLGVASQIGPNPVMARTVPPSSATVGYAVDPASIPMAQPAGATANYALDNPQQLFTNLTIEPDADRDGYGDETQDQCATDASTQGACPASSSPSPDTTGPQVTVAGNAIKLSKKGEVVLDVSCPGSESSCKGTLSLETAGKVQVAALAAGKRTPMKKKVLKLGSASFSIAGGQTQAVKVKLSRKARRTVKKLKKVKAKATITATDAANNTGTSMATLTLKA